MNRLASGFREVWLVDTEFGQQPTGLQDVRCVAARELFSGRHFRWWVDELSDSPPIDIGPDVLIVAYYASAELNTFRVLGWPMPQNILDLYVEFRMMTNVYGLQLPAGRGLLGAMLAFGLSSIATTEKKEMRDLALRGGRYTGAERVALMDYCQTDVDALAELLPRMMPHIRRLDQALHRGRYMKAVSSMEHRGIPVDLETFTRLRDQWGDIQGRLIQEMSVDYDVFDGRSFSFEKFEQYLIEHGHRWPRTAKGRLATDRQTFRDMARVHPDLATLKELKSSLGQMRLFKNLAIGSDGRNLAMLSPFASQTSRNQPSSAKAVFGPSCWVRSLIRPEPGRALAYVDWSSQELGTAGALSGDVNMMATYASGDPYMKFAELAGAVPPGATKHTHPETRGAFKVCMLAVQYGQSDFGLAHRLNVARVKAKDLLDLHKLIYHKFWHWSERCVDHAMLAGHLDTRFGWRLQVGDDMKANPRSLMNFPVQANGAEMMRLAAMALTESGVEVCVTVHDALMVESEAQDIDETVRLTQEAMAWASREVLDGFELRTDAKIVHLPERYVDEDRGREMWQRVMGLLE